MKRYIASLILIVSVVTSLTPYALSYSARSMVLIEQTSRAVIEQTDCDRAMPMASTTKIMTAVIVLENSALDEKVKIPSSAVGVEGSSLYLISGEILTVGELLYGLMLTSGNDVATALAIHTGGTVTAFVGMMNAKADRLGLVNTHFANPSGLPDDTHYTTARELAFITAYALENPVFSEIVSTERKRITYNGVENGRLLKNHNKLLTLYDGAIGVKTGFTKKAGRCLVSAAQKDGVVLICVTLNDGDDWNDHIKAFDYGFGCTSRTLLCRENELCIPLDTADGGTVYATNRNELFAVSVGNLEITRVVRADKFIYAPKTAGEAVGSVEFYENGSLVAQDELYITTDIPAPVRKELLITRIIRYIKRIFTREKG